MAYSNLLADAPPTGAEDQDLVRLVQSGSKAALELLINRHQRWIYNIALRMLCRPQDAQDTTQEILIKVLTKLSMFRGESQFRTWLYRLAVNHLLNMRRTHIEAKWTSFEDYGRELGEIFGVGICMQKVLLSLKGRLKIGAPDQGASINPCVFLAQRHGFDVFTSPHFSRMKLRRSRRARASFCTISCSLASASSG